MNDALEEKRPFTGTGRRPMILLQDNTWPHKAKNSGNHRRLRLGNSSSCGVWAPDLASSDYHLFWSLQHHLSESQFKSVEQMQKSPDEFIESKSPSFFQSGIRQLPERWQKCIETEGDYFEDWV